MKTLVTGSSGHLGEALVRTLRDRGDEVVSLDVIPSPFTTALGSITDRDCVRACMAGVHTVFHAATLHKPHVATHSRQQFVETNLQGTLSLLEEAAACPVAAFVFTSTTSVFGDALSPPPGTPPGTPAVWVTEQLTPIPKNIYGVTKAAAEDLCYLFHRNHGLPCLVLRTSRFFPEQDDDKASRDAHEDANAKVNEFLFRRVDLEDVVSAHLLAAEKAPAIGFGRYIISATTPLLPDDLATLRTNAPAVLRKRVPEHEPIYKQRGWKMFPAIDRVYINAAARNDLHWEPKYDFAYVLSLLREGTDPRSPLARAVGSKRYHAIQFEEGPYPVEQQTKFQP
jgi:nucleoside-diphosphate-sugar epimerase